MRPLLIALTVLATLASADPSAADLMASVEQTYRSARSFRMAVNYHTSPDIGPVENYRVQLAAERHGRFLVTISSRDNRPLFTLVNDGKEFAIYSTGKAFREASGGAAQIAAASQILALLVTQHESLDLRDGAQIIDHKSWHDIPCTIIHTEVPGSGSIHEYWIDETRHTILRHDFRANRKSGSLANASLDWTQVEIDPQFTAADFSFTPPANAKEVDHLLPPDLPWPGIPHVKK